jgi:antitoxin HicB
MVRYPVVLAADDNDTVLVTFPDFPEAQTFGHDEAEALARAVDALETVIDAYIRDRRDIPAPSAVKGPSVTLPTLMATKVQLYTQMRQQGVNKTELAKRLNVHLPQVDRLLDVRHGSQLDQLDAAARALGGHLEISLVVPGRSAAMTVRALQRSRGTPSRVHAGVLAAQKQRRTTRRTPMIGGKKK